MGQIRIKQAKADSVGSIIFSGSGNKLSENNSNLFWDNTNTRLGIRTGDPFNDQVGYPGDTDYASIAVIKTVDGRYGYNHNTGAVEIATYIDTTFTTVEAMIGTTSTHGFGLFTDDLVRLKIDSTGKVGINTGLTALTAQFETYGSGTNSATYGLKIHNSTGTSNTLIVRDDQRVGIRTASPTATLQVHGSSTSNSDFGLAIHNSTGTNNGLVVSNDGLVGIGTAPSYRLHVKENTNNYMYYNALGGEPLTIYSSTATITGFRANRNGTIITIASTSGGACFFDTTAYYDFYTNSTGTHAGRINSSGNWGIGGATIAAKLQITGNGTSASTINQRWTDSSTGYLMQLNDAGTLLIGSTDYSSGLGGETRKIGARQINTNTSDHTVGFFENSIAPTANNTYYSRALTSSIIKSTSYNTSSIVSHLSGCKNDGTGSILEMYGTQAYMLNTAAATISNIAGVYSDKLIQNGTITIASSFIADTTELSGGTISNLFGLYVKTPTNVSGGTRTNTAGVYIESNTTGTNNYGIIVNGTMYNGFGTSTPSNTMHIVGTFKLVDGNQGAGKVLESDANGVGTWTTPSVTATSTTTLTNKRITKRVVAVTSSATPTFNSDNGDIAQLTGLAVNITNMSTNLTGTPNHGDMFCYEITDNGTARTLTWGASFSATTLALPTTTVISTLLRCLFQWNSTTSKWEIIAVV